MRVHSHASEQYRRNSALVEKPRESASAQAHARTKTTTFGFTLGKFGLRYESESTQLDPSLSRDVRERKQKAQAFQSEAEVESLRATIGRQGADYRDRQTTAPTTDKPSPNLVRNALNAYAQSAKDILPPPGAMLAGVV